MMKRFLGGKSYKDVERWMENEFSFDTERFERFKGTLPPPRTPEETFKLKSGIYIDAAIFAKERPQPDRTIL